MAQKIATVLEAGFDGALIRRYLENVQRNARLGEVDIPVMELLERGTAAFDARIEMDEEWFGLGRWRWETA